MKSSESLDDNQLLIHVPKILTPIHSKIKDNTLKNAKKNVGTSIYLGS